MSVVAKDFELAAASKTNTKVKKPRSAEQKRRKSNKHKTPRDCPRVTIRLSVEDYQRLQELADGMALSAYLRCVALNEKLPRRRRKTSVSAADAKLLAQIIGLLGQSRIANNLNQLAYHANIGALDIGDGEKAQINEAYEYVRDMRMLLLSALGVRK